MTTPDIDLLIPKLNRTKASISLESPQAAWVIIKEANRIFGPFNWSRDILDMRNAATRERDGIITTAYVAHVKLSIDIDGRTYHRGAHGCGEGKGSTPFEAHDRGLKAAELDATARAFATMGRALGLIIPPKKEAKNHRCNGSGSKAAKRENTLENGSGARSNEGGHDGFDPVRTDEMDGLSRMSRLKWAMRQKQWATGTEGAFWKLSEILRIHPNIGPMGHQLDGRAAAAHPMRRTG